MTIFKPRTSAPSVSDRNWFHYQNGGTNYCMKVNKVNGDVLANCVGYAWGRWSEILGKFHELSRGDAEVWYGKGDGYERSKTPRLGSVICWSKGIAGNKNDGLGHVAIVEGIAADGTITTSNSAYKGTRFYMAVLKPPYAVAGWNFQGFIHLPGNYEVAPEPVKPALKSNAEIAKEVKMGVWGNGDDRKIRLTRSGYDYNAIQLLVNGAPAKPVLKPIAEMVKEVRLGRWGNGADRIARLRAAGYNAEEIQKEVDKLSKPNIPAKSYEVIAKEVRMGVWGNGADRINKLTAAGYDAKEIQKIVNRK